MEERIKTMSEKVRFGLSNCYYALLTQTGDGTPTWGTPVAMVNAKSITMDRTVSDQPIYADNKLIYTIKAMTGATITLTFTLLSDAIKQALLGHKADMKGHDVEVTNAKTVYFALIFQIEGDTLSRRSVVLKCSASLGSEASETTADSVNVNGDTLNITVYPVSDSAGNDIARYDVDSDDSDYETVLTAAPTIPTFSA